MKTSIDRLLDQVQWEPVDAPDGNTEGLPFMTHQGVLHLMGVDLQCAILSTGQRVFTGDAIEELFTGLRAGGAR